MSHIILNEIAKELNIDVEIIKVDKTIRGSSTTAIKQISLGENGELAILKERASYLEWFFYTNLTDKYNVPAPKLLASSKTSDGHWILLQKITKGLHPRKWGQKHFELAIRAIAQLHAQFYLKTEELKKLGKVPEPLNKENWENTRQQLIEDLRKSANTAKNYEKNTIINAEEFETLIEKIENPKFLDNLLACGTTLVHGDSWIYNIFQNKEGVYFIDWEDYFIGPSIWELIYFYDLSHYFVDGVKITYRKNPLDLDVIVSFYLDELNKNGVELNVIDFNRSFKAGLVFHMAYYWGRKYKPFTLYLKGGRYFVKRVLRLLPSRDDLREHIEKLLKLDQVEFTSHS